MFDFIEKDMTINERENLNFVLSILLLIIILINVMIYLSILRPLLIVSIPILFLSIYCLYRNNQIGLEQERQKRRKR